MAKKKLETLERERGVLLVGDVDLKATYTDEEFTDLLVNKPNDFRGVDYESREQFLKDNGHPITRKTLVDTTLSAKPPKKK